MRYAVQLVVFSTAVLLVLAGKSAGQSQAKPDDPKTDERKIEKKADDKQVKPTLVGNWRADSVSIALADGNRKTLAAGDAPVSLIISEKTCVMRAGGAILASMSYVLDPKQDPWTIDMKSKEGVMLGICAKRGNTLEISLDDQATGRPRDFNKDKHGMVLVLRRFLGWSLLVINADGGNPHPILTMPDFTRVGSPKWSHDGGKIAFDAWRSVMGEDFPDAHVFVVHADGSAPKDLGAGAMPSWSPDDKQLTYCQYGSGGGVWIMDADGSHPRQIDAGGWGSQWSPNRNEIAYVIHDGRGAVLCIYDVATEQRREVPHKPYRQVYFGLTWSPDGKQICFKGILPDGGCEIDVISVEGPKHALKVLLPSSALPEVGNSDCTMAWGGTGNQILVSMQRKTDRLPRLYVFDSTGVTPPQVFPKFPAGWMSNDMVWSSDGKRVVVSALPVE